MYCRCERCNNERSCRYHGRPADVENDKTQNGEWLCEECVPLRARELDAAIATMKSLLGLDGEGR
jgi:hypothetical protein